MVDQGRRPWLGAPDSQISWGMLFFLIGHIFKIAHH